MEVSMIAAMSKNRVIGDNGKLPWSIKEEFKHFKDTTKGHYIILGRKTFEDTGLLPNRDHIVLTNQENYKHNQEIADPRDFFAVDSLEKALDIAHANGESEAFIIGGATIYEQSLNLADKIILTEIQGVYSGDAYFPEINGGWNEVSRESFSGKDIISKKNLRYDIINYEKIK